ncbi:MAG TPA: hypothetical protein VIQ77_11780 [Mucilaginibacter sp.]
MKEISKEVANFTATQNERYNSILPIIGKLAAAAVIINLKGRGRSSWKNTLINILTVNNPKTAVEKNYYSVLDQEIDLDETYDVDLMTQIVCETRYATGMDAFDSKIDHNCQQELFRLFLWEDIYQPSDDDSKPTFIGYKPICRLKK